MPSPPDRKPDPSETPKAEFPFPPKNVSVNSSFLPNSYDLHWTDPSEVQPNVRFQVYGINIYRSYDAPFNRLEKLNSAPLGGNFFRANTQIKVALNENASHNFSSKGDTDPSREWVIQSCNKPIDSSVQLGWQYDLHLVAFVTINGVPARIKYIDADRGQIYLDSSLIIDAVANKTYPAVLPYNETDKVYISYRYISDSYVTSLSARIYYHITTVGKDLSTGKVSETPIKESLVVNNQQIEPLDYIWKEAIRRNKFILDQGGERVKVFIRRQNGPRCGCFSPEHQQGKSDCLVCYGTGILGGYDGPFDYILSPDDGSKNLTQSNLGRTNSHSYEVWGPPFPLINMRDFMVKMNGDRYGFSSVRIPSNRGMQLQQFFSVSYLDHSDVRYKVPVMDTSKLRYPETRYIQIGSGKALPMMTNMGLEPSELQFRGATVAYENIMRRG